MLCHNCEHIPRHPVLLGRGHIYCIECCSRKLQCGVFECHGSDSPATSLTKFAYHALCEIFGIPYHGAISNSDSNKSSDLAETEILTPRASHTFYYLSSGRKTMDIVDDRGEDDFEDDGWEDKSQRSTGYGDESPWALASNDSMESLCLSAIEKTYRPEEDQREIDEDSSILDDQSNFSQMSIVQEEEEEEAPRSLEEEILDLS